MDDDRALEALSDGDYKVYRRPSGDWLARYTVCGPDGLVLAVTSTVRGARRVIQRRRARSERPWWQGEVVHREPSDG